MTTASPHTEMYAYVLSNHLYATLLLDAYPSGPYLQYDLPAWLRGAATASFGGVYPERSEGMATATAYGGW